MTRLVRHILCCTYTQAHRRRRPKPGRAKRQQQSPSPGREFSAVNSRRRPVTRAAQVAKERPACHLTVTCCPPVLSAIRDRQDSSSLPRLQDPERRLRHGRHRPSTQPKVQGRNPPNILISGQRTSARRFSTDLQISLYLSIRPLALTQTHTYTHTHTHRLCCNSKSPLWPCVSRPASAARHFSSSCASHM